MTSSEPVVRTLLRAYPRSWRDEYGEELAGILAHKPLTLVLVANVLANGFSQRLYRDKPWKILGLCVFVWTWLGIYLGSTSLDTPILLAFFGAGIWTVLRNKGGMREASAAAGKVGLACVSSEVLYGLMRMLRDGHDLPQALASGASIVTTLTISSWDFVRILLTVTLLLSMGCGVAGALLGHFLLGFQRGLRKA